MKYIPLIIFLLLFTRPIYIDASDVTQTLNSTVTSLVARYTTFYGVSNTKMMQVITCESRGKTDAYNKKDSDGLPAYGVLQFKKDTFKEFATKVGIENQDIWNPEQQIEVASYMWKNGLQGKWGCYN